MKRKTYSNEFKARVALESLQRDTTIEQIRQKFNVHTTQINTWTKQLKHNVSAIFDNPKRRAAPEPDESVDELRKMIGKLAMENDILKKALESLN